MQLLIPIQLGLSIQFLALSLYLSDRCEFECVEYGPLLNSCFHLSSTKVKAKLNLQFH